MMHSPITDSAFLRIGAYFLVAGAILVTVPQVFPGIQDLVQSDVAAGPVGVGDAFESATDRGRARDLSLSTLLTRGVAGLLTLLDSLIWGIPLAWTYVVTRRQEGFRKAFVQMLIFLPLVVSGVARVVRGDLALAFALAGIVAAVRFRTTVKDPKNAVFAFAAIGIGLSSGSGAWLMAGLLSAAFCAVALTLWRTDIGGLKPELALTVGAVRLSEALVPGELKRTVTVGQNSLVEPLHADERARLPEYVRTLAHHVRTDALRDKGKFQQLLLVYAAEGTGGRETVEHLLDEHDEAVERWQHVDTFPWRDGTEALEYLIRLDANANVSRFLAAFECGHGCPLRAVEIKPMRGLRTRLTA